MKVVFYKTRSGKEPVRQWLQKLTRQEKKTIGEDIKTVQFGWPLGLPIVRKLGSDLWEVRSHVRTREARVLFTIVNENLVLLHGFFKKTQKTSRGDIKLAMKRASEVRS